jgi:hypothetical protein
MTNAGISICTEDERNTGDQGRVVVRTIMGEGHGKERQIGWSKEGNTPNLHECDNTPDPSQQGEGVSE